MTVNAAHIVGGEIEFITISPGVYKIRLIQYRDENQDINSVVEQNVTVALFSNKDNERISNLRLLFEDQTEVFYTNVDCSIEELQTTRVVWSATFELDPKEFADEEGYYITWDRCCRNANVVNILNSGGAGMQYILDIPPLYKNGQPFINSSPILNKPLSDYACVGQLFYTSFIGQDPDGDSLVYRMAVPLGTKNANRDNPAPLPDPKPKLEIRWAQGFDIDNVIPGSPALGISSRGLLTVNPKTRGLYVFSVVVEEWRDDAVTGVPVKIGEVQRDFQMLVIDGCKPPPPPSLDIVIPGNETFDPRVDTLKYAVEDDKCFYFKVTNVMQGEKVSFRADPVSFNGEYEILKDLKYTIGLGNEALIEFCAPDCPPTGDRPFVVDFIVEDDICPLPQLDTVRMTLQIEPPPNTNVSLSPIQDVYNVPNGDKITFDFEAIDAENDFIDLSLIYSDVLTPQERGMFFQINVNEPGRVAGTFTFEVDCNTYDLSDKQNFTIGIIAEDNDQCESENPVIEWVDLNAFLPGNTNPEIMSSSSNNLEIEFGEKLTFEITVEDLDNDPVSLRMIGDGFDPENLGVTFQNGQGLGTLSEEFSWTPQCSEINILAKDEYKFYFLAEDDDICHITNYDTLEVLIKINLPQNNAPVFQPIPRNYQIEVNTDFELEIMVSDEESDQEITLGFYDSFRRPNSNTLQFESAKGNGSISSLLTWTPECNLLELGETSRSFDLYLLATDNNCPINGLDTMRLSFEIYETRESFVNFDPPDVFTPNGDNWNNVFKLSGFDDRRRNLPNDNCEDSFQFIVIQDRSGKTVFESKDRNFSWTGGNHPTGTYFYLIQYSRTNYKGYLTMLK